MARLATKKVEAEPGLVPKLAGGGSAPDITHVKRTLSSNLLLKKQSFINKVIYLIENLQVSILNYDNTQHIVVLKIKITL